MIIRFEQQPAFELATEVLKQPLLLQACRLNSLERVIEIEAGPLGELLNQISNSTAVVLPIFGKDKDRWLIAGVDRYATDQAFSHAIRFVLPTYAELSDAHKFGVFRGFLPGGSALHDAASVLYAGYYDLQSPPQYRAVVLGKLAQWSRLRARQPQLIPEQTPTYADVLARFNSAVAAMRWPAAESALAEMREYHLCAADNLSFLRIQLLAQQGHWKAIWEDATYPQLAAMHVPRAVRSVLIIACHFTLLLEPEQNGDINRALALFKEAKPRLGNLLNGRFQLSDSAVIRMFGYQAVIAEDRFALESLKALADLDLAARACLGMLEQKLPPQLPVLQSPANRLRRAMNDRDYDAAVQAAKELKSPVESMQALLRIAIYQPDASKYAVEAFDALSPQAREELAAVEPALDFYLERILYASQPGEARLLTWPAWFETLFKVPTDTQLSDALAELGTQPDDRNWTPEAVQSLTRNLEALFGNSRELLVHKHVRRALHILVDQFLADQQFPQHSENYTELYSILYACFVLLEESKEESISKLLRLADAVLRNSPDQIDSVSADLKRWFARPTPVLENLLLDAFELLVTYGATRDRLANTYRDWLSHRLELPPSVPWDQVNQEVWLSFGQWLQPGDDLLLPLQRRLEKAAKLTVDDPIANLPEGFRISIFTLAGPSAERASELLRRRNDRLDIRICVEMDMNPQVESLARNCDVAVVVTSCIKHAITYGIGPLLQRSPVYPASRGSASIVRSIEEFAMRLGS